MHDIAVHIGQAEISAGVVESQSFVVQTEQVQNGRVPIMDVDGVFDRLIAEIVSRTVAGTSP